MSADAPTADRLRRLQVGCGRRFHPAWLNLDLQPLHPTVRRHDVTLPLPFPDRCFDAVYHAHLLEHLPRSQALPFLRECLRVLKPGGILRVVVPDLEQIVRLYLAALDGAWRGDAEAQQRHAWAMLEMYDQMVRDQPGGAMLDYLRGAQPCDLAWYRLGADGRIIRQHLERVVVPPADDRERTGWVCQCLAALKLLACRSATSGRPSNGTRTRALFVRWRERVIRWLLGRDYALLQLGRFRRGGEVHLWMYDRQSLREIVTAAGFSAFRLTAAGESAIAGWTADHLDTQPDGTPIKPDSLYAEAVRP